MHIGSRYDTGSDGMMQISHRDTLFENVGHDLALRHESGVELLLLRIVGAYGGNEGAGRDLVKSEQRLPRGCAGNAVTRIPRSSPSCCARRLACSALWRAIALQQHGLTEWNVGTIWSGFVGLKPPCRG